MMEYEYSFEVKDLDEVFNYLKVNNYKKIEDNSQIRVLYENESNTILRVTTNIVGNYKKTFLDFKTKKSKNDTKIFHISKESNPITIDNNEIKNIDTIIDVLDYKEVEKLDRIRYVYEKENIRFEIDKYVLPREAMVVAIEGDKDKVNKVYNYIKLLSIIIEKDD